MALTATLVFAHRFNGHSEQKKKCLAGKEDADAGYVCVVTAKNDTV